MLPLAGAYLAEWAGMTTLFGLIVCGGLLAMISAIRMTPETDASFAEEQPLQAIPSEPQDEP